LKEILQKNFNFDLTIEDFKSLKEFKGSLSLKIIFDI